MVLAPDGTTHVLDFREVAPSAATQDMYQKASDPQASRIGGLAVAVPGEASGLVALHERWGRLSLDDVAAPAIRLSRDGFVVEAHLAKSLHNMGKSAIELSEGLFDRAQVPLQGDRVQRLKLAKTLEAFASSSGRALSEGKIAEDIVDAAQEAGGILSRADLVAYAPKDREPLVGMYRGWKIVTMPPPSSGGAVLLQVLGVLEATELTKAEAHSAGYYHRLAEAMKHAFADRARFMGDPERVNVPLNQLLSRERIEAVQKDFDPSRTRSPEHYGTTTIHSGTDGGTQHISVLDSDGLGVALTTTINTSFASRVVAPKSGILLNNEMDDFVARPGQPNHYGLVGSEANAVAPGARPLSSMSPTILVSPDGTERIVVGASGGPFIISSTLQAIVNVVDFGMDPAEAVSVPRIHHQWVPDLLFVDTHTSPDTIAALEALGHTVKVMDFFSSVQLIHGSEDGMRGASDPRKGGWPAGVP